MFQPIKAFVASTGDIKAYNEALSYLKGYSAQSGQPALGTDVLLALPGAPGIIARTTLVASGGYQTGTGIGQVVDGNYREGALNIGLGTTAIFGGMVGQGIISNIDKGTPSAVSSSFWQESGQSVGKNIFHDNNIKISSENQKYVDIISPEAKQHILYGESMSNGGHMYPGKPEKTIYPSTWSADKIVHVVGDIATSPNTQWYAQTGTGGLYTKAGQPARWVAWEIRDDVRMRVVYSPANGQVITAFPDKNLAPATLKPIK